VLEPVLRLPAEHFPAALPSPPPLVCLLSQWHPTPSFNPSEFVNENSANFMSCNHNVGSCW